VNFLQLTQRIRVPAGFLLAPVLFISAQPTYGSLIAGAFVAISGLAIRAWASGHLRKNEKLTTSGPYAHTRNPLYLGTFLLGTGVAISGGTPWFVGLFMALYLFIYVPVMFAEADTMRRLFKGEYEDYSRHVPLFLPRATAYHTPEVYPGETKDVQPEMPARNRFESALYRRHREYRAALGLIVVYVLLAAKLYLNGLR